MPTSRNRRALTTGALGSSIGHNGWADPTFGAVLDSAEPRERTELAKPRCGESVYFIHAPKDGSVKIGYSRHPVKRVEAIRQNSPPNQDLRLVGAIDGGFALEQLLHERFAKHQIRGEWFEDAILGDVHELIADDREWFGAAA